MPESFRIERMLAIKTLGRVQFRQDGGPRIDFGSRKTEALLIYLSAQGQSVDRSVLAGLLWEGRTNNDARANLSVLLNNVKQQLDDVIFSDRQTIWLNPGYDIETDFGVLESADLNLASAQALAKAYRGDFLAGYFIKDAVGFERWAALERERIREQVLAQLQVGARYALLIRRHDIAEDLAKSLQHIDPLNESHYRLQMQLDAVAGNRSHALETFETLKLTLFRELEVELVFTHSPAKRPITGRCASSAQLS